MEAMSVPVQAPTQGAAYCGPPGGAQACDDAFSQLLAALLGGCRATEPWPVKAQEGTDEGADAESDAAVPTPDGPVVAPEMLAVLQTMAQPAPAPAEALPRLTEEQLAPATRATSHPAPPLAIVARDGDGKPLPRGTAVPAEPRDATASAGATTRQPVQPLETGAPTGRSDAPDAFQSSLSQAQTMATADGKIVATVSASLEPTPASPTAAVVESGLSAAELGREGAAGSASAIQTPVSSMLDVESEQDTEHKPAPVRVEAGRPFEVVPQQLTMERVAADSQPVAKEAPRWLGGPEFREQLLTNVRLLARTDGGQAEMQLQPESLGRLHVSMQVHSGQISLHLAAESAQAREAIVGRLGDLADAFSSAGLTLAQVNVTVGDQPRRGPDWSARPDVRRSEQEQRPVEAVQASPWLHPLSLLDLSA